MEQPKEDIERVMDRLHEEGRRSRSDTKAFAAIARGYHLQIQAMREEGYSYIEICSAFEKENLLPEKSNIESFRQACRRQLIRQAKKEIRPASQNGALAQPAKQLAGKPQNGKSPEKPAPPNRDAEALAREKREKQLGERTVIETANGTIVKNGDGGFDF